MRTPVLIVTVVLIHAVAIGSVVFMQGCGTQRTASVEPPPAPVMPPKEEMRVAPPTQPVFQAPRPVQPAPSMSVPTGEKIYVVQKGDVLSKIAVRTGVSVRELIEINNIKDKHKIFVGQKLMLPDYARGGTVASSVPVVSSPRPAAESVPAGGTTYAVQKGDNLTKIARRYGVKIRDLRAANGLEGDKILVGQKLTIPEPGSVSSPAPKKKPAPVREPVMEEPKTVAPTPESMAVPTEVSEPEPTVTPPSEPTLASQNQPLDYTVQEGDTIETIAKLFIVRKEDLMSINGISDPNGALQPGQKIKIPPTEF